ncbi:MAG: hypothetical protein RIA65_08775, partial [Woeseia sp.]
MRNAPCVVLVAMLASACGQAPSSALPALGAAKSMTVSGVSSGAYMAGQFQVAYSADVDGAALIAGGPWGCAGGDISRALGECMNGMGIATTALVQQAQTMAIDLVIDAIAQLGNDRVFLFHGSADSVVAESVTTAAADWYGAAAPDAVLQTVTGVPVSHGWPTVSAGIPCGEFAAPFVYACDYDLAGEALEFLLGPLQPPSATPAALQSFSQEEFAGAGLADTGYFYAPETCRKQSGCSIHVFFHGCGQSAEQIGTVLAEQGGLLPWADSNELIILFPQVAVSRVSPVNPLACWDWWGYSGA